MIDFEGWAFRDEGAVDCKSHVYFKIGKTLHCYFCLTGVQLLFWWRFEARFMMLGLVQGFTFREMSKLFGWSVWLV